MPTQLPIQLNHAMLPVHVAPGDEIVIRGKFYSTDDGATVDAVTTTWPSGAPGGASVDAHGLVDLEAGGFHLVMRDPASHEVHAVATGQPGPACQVNQTPSPCLPLRLTSLAHSRLTTVDQWSRTLKGEMTVEVPTSVAHAPFTKLPLSAGQGFLILGSLAVASFLSIAGWRLYRARTTSPALRLACLARQVRAKAAKADSVLSAPLEPALRAAEKALRLKRFDPRSAEGLRIERILRMVDTRLDDDLLQRRKDEERQAVDGLVREVEVALDAAQEAHQIGAGRRK